MLLTLQKVTGLSIRKNYFCENFGKAIPQGIVLLENLAAYGMCLKNRINLLRGQILKNHINFSHAYNCTFTVTSTQRKPSLYSVSVTRGEGRLVR